LYETEKELEETKRKIKESLGGSKELLNTGSLLYNISKATSETVWKVFNF
jgi:hypothetical protein